MAIDDQDRDAFFTLPTETQEAAAQVFVAGQHLAYQKGRAKGFEEGKSAKVGTMLLLVTFSALAGFVAGILT